MNKFEEYKLFVEDTAKFSERRQTVNNTYVAVNSIILTAVSFLVKDAGFQRRWQAAVVILVLIAGIVICSNWKSVIKKYESLVGHRINQLREMEKSPEMSGCHGMYHSEDKLYPRDANGIMIKGKGLNLAVRERWLPNIFLAVYAIFLVGTAYMLLFAPHLLNVPQAAK